MLNNKISVNMKTILDEMNSLDESQILPTMLEEAKQLRQFLYDCKKPFLIEVCGNIGFGKTTVAEIIANQTGMNLLLESDDDFLLKQYYDDMSKYSERLQTHLISQRLYSRVIHQLKNPSQSLICDRSPYEDTLVFSEALTEYNLLSKESLNYVYWYFENEVKQLKLKYSNQKIIPDLLICVHGGLEVGWNRVIQRKREMEVRNDAKVGRGLTKDFYSSLHKKYDSLVPRLQELNWYTGPILFLDQNQLHISDAKLTKGWLYIVKSLHESLKILAEENK